MAASKRPQARQGPVGAGNRLKPANIDPLDVYGLPSKGETGLHDHKAQEKYYDQIVERYTKLHVSSGRGEELENAFGALSVKDGPPRATPPAASPGREVLSHPALTANKSSDMPNILMAMRKLREGMLGSRRRDHFAQRAYVFIIHASILARHWESYQPALFYLLNDIHPHTPLSPSELQEFAGYRILDLACRQHELMDAFAVKLMFKHQDRRVHSVLLSLAQDDWVRFWRVKRVADGCQRALMEFAVDRMRRHALDCLGRGYMYADRAFIERSGDASWPELVKGGVGWQLQENGNVVIRKPKPK